MACHRTSAPVHACNTGAAYSAAANTAVKAIAGHADTGMRSAPFPCTVPPGGGKGEEGGPEGEGPDEGVEEGGEGGGVPGASPGGVAADWLLQAASFTGWPMKSTASGNLLATCEVEHPGGALSGSQQ